MADEAVAVETAVTVKDHILLMISQAEAKVVEINHQLEDAKAERDSLQSLFSGLPNTVLAWGKHKLHSLFG